MALYKVFVVTADTMAEMGKIAHSLGNRHTVPMAQRYFLF